MSLSGSQTMQMHLALGSQIGKMSDLTFACLFFFWILKLFYWGQKSLEKEMVLWYSVKSPILSNRRSPVQALALTLTCYGTLKELFANKKFG